MKNTLEGLWNDYLADECAKIDTDEERELANKAVELHEKLSTLLNKEQECVLEKYDDALCDIQALFIKNAFFKGCEFSVSFLLESGNFKK